MDVPKTLEVKKIHKVMSYNFYFRNSHPANRYNCVQTYEM